MRRESLRFATTFSIPHIATGLWRFKKILVFQKITLLKLRQLFTSANSRATSWILFSPLDVMALYFLPYFHRSTTFL